MDDVEALARTGPARVVALMGLPGAGKSVVARMLEREFDLRLVSRDAIRAAMFPRCEHSFAEKQAALHGVVLAIEINGLLGASSVIDGVWSSVGPSWCEHVERGGSGMNMIVLDAEFGARVQAAFRDDAARSRAGARIEPLASGPSHRSDPELTRHLEPGP